MWACQGAPCLCRALKNSVLSISKLGSPRNFFVRSTPIATFSKVKAVVVAIGAFRFCRSGVERFGRGPPFALRADPVPARIESLEFWQVGFGTNFDDKTSDAQARDFCHSHDIWI